MEKELSPKAIESVRASLERIRHATAEAIENYDRQQIEYHNRIMETNS